MIVNRDDMMRAYEWWRHVWYRGIRYEKAVLWADFYHEERWCIFWGHDWCEGTHVHKQVVMDRWINMMVNKEMKRGYMRCIIKLMDGEGNRGAMHIGCFVYGYIWGCWMLH